MNWTIRGGRVSNRTTRYSQGKFGRFQGMSQNISYTLDNKKVANFFKWLRGERVNKNDAGSDYNTDDDEDDYFDRETNEDKTLQKAVTAHGRRTPERPRQTKMDIWISACPGR